MFASHIVAPRSEGSHCESATSERRHASTDAACGPEISAGMRCSGSGAGRSRSSLSTFSPRMNFSSASLGTKTGSVMPCCHGYTDSVCSGAATRFCVRFTGGRMNSCTPHASSAIADVFDGIRGGTTLEGEALPSSGAVAHK